MAKYFVACDTATPEQRNKITNYLDDLGGYWHWLPDFWLVITTPDYTAASIRDDLKKEVPGLQLLVMKVESPQSGWAGLFPSKGAEWLNKYWKQEQ